MNAERTTLAFFGLCGTLPFFWGAVTQFVQISLSANLLWRPAVELTYVHCHFCLYVRHPLEHRIAISTGRKPSGLYFHHAAVMPALLLFAVMVFVPRHLHLALVCWVPDVTVG